MKRKTYKDKTEWLEARRGTIGGSGAKKITKKVRGTGLKEGVYELIAERVAIPRGDENRMDRGHTLEQEAVERLSEDTGIPFVQVDHEIWSHDETLALTYSPDGYVDGEKITVACEIKCLDSAKHIEAIITDKIPSEHSDQVLQAFVVNEDLETLYFALYDPSMPVDLKYFIVKRDELAESIQARLQHERDVLSFVDEWVTKLTF